MSTETSLARLKHCATFEPAHFGGPHGMFVDVPVRDLLAITQELERYQAALSRIAEAATPPDQHGHYLAHREAVRLARAALA